MADASSPTSPRVAAADELEQTELEMQRDLLTGALGCGLDSLNGTGLAASMATAREAVAAFERLVIAAARRTAFADCQAGIVSAAGNKPAIMNPDTMLHIAENLPIWADHQQHIRALAAREER